MTNTPLWAPSPAAVDASQLTAFTDFAAEKTGFTFENYDALHAWSVADPGLFWSLFWDFTGLRPGSPPGQPVINLETFPGTRWFPDATLNYAENLLGEPADKIAFISLLENGERRTCTYQNLHDHTAHIATQLRRLKLQPGERVAGWLPNIPEAAIAMLATSSIGGVWSSCSPDFGASGALDRFGQIEPRVLFACDGYHYAGKVIDITDKVRQVAAQVPSIQTIVWIDVLQNEFALKDTEVRWGDWLSSPASPLEFLQLPFDHPLYILYSSGTTGKPKCIVHGQGGTLLQHKKEHQLHLNLQTRDILFFFTTCGWMMWNWLVSALASRCTIVLYDGSPFHPQPSAMFDLCQAEGVSVFGTSAKFLSSAQSEGLRPVQSHDLTAMRMLISTGSPLTEQGFSYVYSDVKPDCHLVSMSGGTDLISCFLLGNPNMAVYEGELQSAGLGMAVEVWDDDGNPLSRGKGELVCTVPFPSSPVGFWNDPDDTRYRAAYFERFANTWLQGDYAEITSHKGYIIHGRSDAVLNPGGVRIGTAEIYRQVEHFDDIVDAVCVGQDWQDDVRIVLFVVMRDTKALTPELIDGMMLRIRNFASPRHIPAKIIQVTDIPRTMSGKIAELAVRDTIHERPVKNTSALANPDALQYFRDLDELNCQADENLL